MLFIKGKLLFFSVQNLYLMKLNVEFQLFYAFYQRQMTFFSVGSLPYDETHFWGYRMTPAPKGDNTILTYKKDVLTLSIAGSNYEWIKLPHELTIDRRLHVQALVPASTIQC